MTDEKKRDDMKTDEAVRGEDAPKGDKTAGGQDARGAKAASKPEAVQDEAQSPDSGLTQAEVEQLRGELAEAKDRMMRAVAEAENVRRRADKERQDILKFGATSLAKEILPVVDNLRRALDAVPEEQRKSNEAVDGLVTGVAMTERMLLEAFEKNGIRKLDPLGEKFSHAEHQAISEAPDTGKPAGTVVQVLQPGYKLHDRLLRPAMVIVAKGGTPPPSPDQGEKVDTTA